MALKVITADEANALWSLGVPLWFYTDSVGEWRWCANCGMKPFWDEWLAAVATSNPQLAVEVE